MWGSQVTAPRGRTAWLSGGGKGRGRPVWGQLPPIQPGVQHGGGGGSWDLTLLPRCFSVLSTSPSQHSVASVPRRRPPAVPALAPSPRPALPHPAGGSLGADTVSRGPHLLTPRGPSPLQLLVVSCDAAAQGPGFRPLPHKRKVCVEGDVIPEIPSGMGAPSKGGEAALVSQFQG